VLADHSLKNTAELELICPRCGYRMMRMAARLRRETGIMMNADQNGKRIRREPRHGKPCLSALMCSVATIACGDAVKATHSL
jgi:hypothetical protein